MSSDDLESVSCSFHFSFTRLRGIFQLCNSAGIQFLQFAESASKMRFLFRWFNRQKWIARARATDTSLGSKKSSRRWAQLQGNDDGTCEAGMWTADWSIQNDFLHSCAARNWNSNALEYVYHRERLLRRLQAFAELHRCGQHANPTKLSGLHRVCVTDSECSFQLDEYLR